MDQSKLDVAASLGRVSNFILPTRVVLQKIRKWLSLVYLSKTNLCPCSAPGHFNSTSLSDSPGRLYQFWESLPLKSCPWNVGLIRQETHKKKWQQGKIGGRGANQDGDPAARPDTRNSHLVGHRESKWTASSRIPGFGASADEVITWTDQSRTSLIPREIQVLLPHVSHSSVLSSGNRVRSSRALIVRSRNADLPFSPRYNFILGIGDAPPLGIRWISLDIVPFRGVTSLSGGWRTTYVSEIATFSSWFCEPAVRKS